jgi:hypothetical protein
MIMPVSDGGSPFAVQQNAGPASPPSGTWTVTARNTGTASPGTTQIQLSMDCNSSHPQPASDTGWSCDTTAYGATDPSYRSQNIVSQFLLGPDSPVVQMTAGIWTYYGVPGPPGGVMQQIYP